MEVENAISKLIESKIQQLDIDLIVKNAIIDYENTLMKHHRCDVCCKCVTDCAYKYHVEYSIDVDENENLTESFQKINAFKTLLGFDPLFIFIENIKFDPTKIIFKINVKDIPKDMSQDFTAYLYDFETHAIKNNIKFNLQPIHNDHIIAALQRGDKSKHIFIKIIK